MNAALCAVNIKPCKRKRHANFNFDDFSDSSRRRRIPIYSFNTNYNWFGDESFCVGMHANWCSVGRVLNLVGRDQRAEG